MVDAFCLGNGKGAPGRLGSLLADQHRYAIGLGLSLEAASNVHSITHGRVVEADVRAEVADQALAAVDADADAQRQEGLTGRRRLLGTLLVQARHARGHGERRPAGVGGMVAVVKRRVPKRHDGIRSDEHTAELQSPMRLSSSVFSLKKKNYI